MPPDNARSLPLLPERGFLLSMRVLGIDPGFGTTGLGLIESSSASDLRAIEWLTIATEAALPLPDRLREIYNDLKTFIAEVKPDLAVVEKVFFSTNVKTAIDVSQARGVILLCLAESGIPLLEPGPLQMKTAITGDGRADKRQVQDMIVRILNLKEIPRPDDAADALALAVYGAIAGRELVLIGREA